MFYFAEETMALLVEFLIPIVISPAVPRIEEIGDGCTRPSQLGIGAGDDEERFAPGEDTLESLSKTADRPFLGTLSPQTDLGDGIAVLLGEAPVVRNQ